MTKLLVASGTYIGWRERDSDYQNLSIEIINLDDENPNLKCDDLPYLSVRLDKTTGHLLSGETPIICGENSSGKCICQTYQNGKWSFTPAPTTCPLPAASVTLKNLYENEVLFFSTGFSSDAVLTFNGTVWDKEIFANPSDFDFGNCIVKINSSTFYSIGGYIDGKSSNATTYFYNALTNKKTIGPPLNIGRFEFGCSILTWKNTILNKMEKIVVVAGGYTLSSYDSYISSVELLYLASEENTKGTWKLGPALPNPGWGLTMVEYGSSVIAIGGGGWGFDSMDGFQLFQLSSPAGPWVVMRQSLRVGRHLHVSFLVPDHLVNCHE